MIPILKKSLDVLQTEGFRRFISKSKRNVENSIERIIFFEKENVTRLKRLKNKYQGKRVFLIGNGPSLNLTPLYFLKDEYTMVFNRFNIMLERLNWKPTFYMVCDSVVAKDMSKEINDIVPMVKYAFFPDIHTDGTNFKKFILSKENVIWLQPYFKGFYTNLPYISLGGTVAFAAMQVLIYLGFKEIILLGVDMNYKLHMGVKNLGKSEITALQDDDPNHFDPRYFGKNRSYHQPDQEAVSNMLNSFELAAKVAKERGVAILNAGLDSAVTCFKKVDFYSLFNFDEKEIFRLFFECLGMNSNYTSISSAFPQITEIKDISEWDNSKKEIMVNEDLAKRIIKDKIFKYIPYGPIKGMFIFKKRI